METSWVLPVIVAFAVIMAALAALVLVARRSLQRLLPPPDDVSEPPHDAISTPSGLRYKVLTPGAGGQRPGPRDQVTVHYSGWQTDGQMFDSSRLRGQPSTFRLDQVIKGWKEGVGLMTPGDHWRMWFPAELAYGERPRSGPGGMLVFDVELLAVGDDAFGNT